MPQLSTHFSRVVSPRAAAEDLVRQVEGEFGDVPIAGGLLVANAASGIHGPEIGRLLSATWPEAELLGTSFEGVLAQGRVWRDEPAFWFMAWAEGPCEPLALAYPAGELDPECVASEVLDSLGGSSLGPSDLVLLLPDSVALPRLDAWIGEFQAALGEPTIVGGGASGVDGAPALAWSAGEERKGGLVGLIFPAESRTKEGVASEREGTPRVELAGASRSASPWLEVTDCRRHWVDRLDDEPSLDWVRRQLGLENGDAIEPLLDRLLIRLRRRRPQEAGADLRRSEWQDPDPDRLGARDYDERYVVGLDLRRSAFSLPIPIAHGDQIAFALPDAGIAREALRDSIDRLPRTGLMMQFSCRTRDASLHGDDDLESAVASHHASGRTTIGTQGPFQLGPTPSSRIPRIHVHATLLASLGPAIDQT